MARAILLAAAMAFAWTTVNTQVANGRLLAAHKPNIVVIVADDLGYGEIPPSGEQPIPTPHIRSIATGGVAFTSGYVSCPVCSPTRAGLMTGRYQQRFGHEFNTGPARAAAANVGLPIDQVTLADRLKKQGYATGMVGKWHLGYAPKFHPMKRGFDEFFGFLGGAHSYVDSQADLSNRILRGTSPVEEKSYLTDAFGREAVAYIDRHKGEPFFLYLTFNAVHTPLEAGEVYTARFEKIEDQRRRTYAGMQSAMDDAVGQVLGKLRDEKLEDNTLVVFVGDNGGPTPRTTSRNDPLRGFKGQVWEGGTRVPFFVQWKAKLPAGKVYDRPVISLDILPTCVVAAGGTVSGDDNLDGVDLVPYLTGKESGSPHEALFWRYGPQWAVRKGDYKLVKPASAPAQLIDLATDISEQRDISADKPELRKELETAYAAWSSQLEEARWAPRGRARGAAAKAKGKGKGKGKGKRKAKPPAADATQ